MYTQEMNPKSCITYTYKMKIAFDPIKNKQIDGFEGIVNMFSYNIFTITDFSVTFKNIISFPAVTTGMILVFRSRWSSIVTVSSFIRLDTIDKKTFTCRNEIFKVLANHGSNSIGIDFKYRVPGLSETFDFIQVNDPIENIIMNVDGYKPAEICVIQ
jgi:hypothetical protein